jgi:hypothetical protein
VFVVICVFVCFDDVINKVESCLSVMSQQMKSGNIKLELMFLYGERA